MPHTTPARELLRVSRQALRERELLASEERLGATKKQLAYNKYMLKEWKARVAEALRAYVNDLLVDDDMGRTNLVDDLSAMWVFSHLRCHTTNDTRDLSSLKLIASEHDPSSPRNADKKWFGIKRQSLFGISVPKSDPEHYYNFDRPMTYTTYVQGVLTQGVSTALGSVSEDDSAANIFKRLKETAIHSVPYLTAKFNTCPPIGSSVGKEPEQDVPWNILNRRTVTLNVIGPSAKLARFPVPLIGIIQEMECQLFIQAMFVRDCHGGLVPRLPADLTKLLFYWVVLRPAELTRQENRGRIKELMALN